MATETDKGPATYVRENYPGNTVKKLHSLSESTAYQSEAGEFESSRTLEEAVCDTVVENEENYELDYSKILTELELKSKTLETGTQLRNSLNEIFSELCDIEYTYVEKLRVLKDKINLKDALNSMQTVAILSAFKSYITKMAETHSEFLDSVSNECYLESKNQDLTELGREIGNLIKELDNYKSDRLLCLGAMKESYFKAKNAVSLCLDATHQAPTIKTSIHKTVIPVILEFIEVNNQVTKYEEFNYFMDFNNRFDLVIKAMDELDKGTSHEIFDILSKFMVCETSKLRNLQYDLNSLIESLNNFDTSVDSNENFMTTKKSKFPENVGTKYMDLVQNEHQENLKNVVPTTSIQPPPYRVISKIQNDMQRFLDSLWGEGEEISVDEFEGEVQSLLIRQVFCDMLSKNASSHPELKTGEKFKLLVDMANSVLSVSERQADYWCGYSIIKFSDKFYTPKECVEGGRWYLWESIADSSYWKNRTFWEECLTIVLSMDLKAMFETNSCLEGSVKAINCEPSTEDAKKFYTWMIKSGIPEREGEELIHSVCQRLKVPETYINSLVGKNDLKSSLV